MNSRILVADPRSDVLALVRASLPRHDVVAVTSAAEALRTIERKGPFAVVLADHDLPDMTGTELLAHVRELCPDTIRMVMTGIANFDVVVEALHRGSIFRFLRKPLDDAALQDAIAAGVERFREFESERLLTEQLQFSRESLVTLTEILERRLADHVARLRGLQKFAFDLNETDSMRDVAELTASRTSRLLGARSVRVVLSDPRTGDELVALAGGALGDAYFSEPILTTSGPVGRIEVDADVGRGLDLSGQDREILASIAASASIASNSQVHKRWREDAQHATIFGLARLAEYRDDETGKHLDRVSAYCRLIAQALQRRPGFDEVVTDAFVKDIVLSAPLHDIGKVGVPDSILLKPGQLTEEEWVLMRKHPTIGAETLLHVLETSGEQSFMRMAHEIAWCHHERWDGTGYPRGLRGQAIPLAARIMAVADCYDALTSWRPYKQAWTHAAAIEHLREQSGTQFDPAVALAFVEREVEADRIRERMADEPPPGRAMSVA